MLKKTLKSILERMGYKIVPSLPDFTQYDSDFIDIYNSCKEYTMSSIDRMYSLYQSVNYIIDNNLEGDFVECGVWRGGSAMVIAKTLLSRGIRNRKLFLFDTYEGMTEPTNEDVDKNNNNATALLKNSNKTLGESRDSIWCIADIEDVTKNMIITGYPLENVSFVKGKVEDTLLDCNINKLSLLRLDTDWFQSTKVEMEILFPKLIKNGVLIIDDYGHWQGAKKAVDEYFALNKLSYLMYKIDYTGRALIKI